MWRLFIDGFYQNITYKGPIKWTIPDHHSKLISNWIKAGAELGTSTYHFLDTCIRLAGETLTLSIATTACSSKTGSLVNWFIFWWRVGMWSFILEKCIVQSNWIADFKCKKRAYSKRRTTSFKDQKLQE